MFILLNVCVSSLHTVLLTSRVEHEMKFILFLLKGAAAAFCFGYVKCDWRVYGELLLGVCTLLEGLVILWSSQVTLIIHAYLAYILFGVLYHIMMTVSK